MIAAYIWCVLPIRPKRPVGITVLAISFLWIGCIGTLFFPLIIFAGGGNALWRLIANTFAHSASWPRGVEYFIFSIWYLAYLAYAVMGFGLWKMRNWARRAVVWIQLTFGVLCLLAAPFFAKFGILDAAVVTGIVSPVAWLIWYLQRPRVRFAFKALPPDADMPPGLSKAGWFGVAVGIAANFALYAALLLISIEGMIHSTDVYKIALKQAQDSPCVAELIGSPITPGWMTTGNMETSADRGSANLEIPVSGPKGKGTFTVVAEKRNSVWNITSLTLESGSRRIETVPSPAGSSCQETSGIR